MAVAFEIPLILAIQAALVLDPTGRLLRESGSVNASDTALGARR